jgi:hypothetical protein
VRPEDDYLLLHESDLHTPPDLVGRFLKDGLCPIAGWITLTVNGYQMFYDTWAYRKDGQMFSNYPPYHPCYTPDQPFEVDSFGSCWLCYAEDIRAGARCERLAVLDLCRQFKDKGRRLWIDPTIPVVQPTALWTSREHAAV